MTPQHPEREMEREAKRWSAAWWIAKVISYAVVTFGSSAIGYHMGMDRGRDDMRCAIMTVLYDLNTADRPGEMPKNCEDYVLRKATTSHKGASE